MFPSSPHPVLIHISFALSRRVITRTQKSFPLCFYFPLFLRRVVMIRVWINYNFPYNQDNDDDLNPF